MLEQRKSRWVCFFALLLFIVSVLVPNMIVYATNTIDSVPSENSSSTISSVNFEAFDSNGCYPASLNSFFYNLEVKIKYKDGKSEVLSSWLPTYSELAYGYATRSSACDDFYLYFYDKEDKPLKLSVNQIPIGEYVIKLKRGSEKVIYKTPIKILEPSEIDISAKRIIISPSDQEHYEECWYPLELSSKREYIFRTNESEFANYFDASIWTRNDNNTVVKISPSVSSTNPITVTKSDGDPLYLVVSEKKCDISSSGTILWSAKKEIESLEIHAESSYKAWNRDILSIPVAVTYTDGSEEIVDNWNVYSEINTGNEQYHVTSLIAITSNDDTLHLGATTKGMWVDSSTNETLIPGTSVWKVVCEGNNEASDTATITIENPETHTISLYEDWSEEFYLESGSEAAYSFQTDIPTKIEVVNQGQTPIRAYIYMRYSFYEPWTLSHSTIISANTTVKEPFESDSVYMIILSSGYDNANGRLQPCVNVSAASAALEVDSIDSGDYSTWTRLPICVNFADNEEESFDSQTITSWMQNQSPAGTAYAYTQYNEKICYALYKGSTLIPVPILSEEIIRYLESETDPEQIDRILQKFGFTGGVDSLMIPSGTYTVKIYRTGISDKNLLGTQTVNVINSKDPDGLAITLNPTTKQVKSGTTASFSVKARGSNLTYQWQYRTSSADTWKNAVSSGSKSSKFKVDASIGRSGYQFRCRVKDSSGNKVYSKTASLYVLGIKNQPDSVTIKAGKTAKFVVSASGHNKTYQWQYRTSSKGTWKNATSSGSESTTFKIAATTSRNGYQFRCRVKDSAGNLIVTDTVTLHVLGIKEQPESVKIKAGNTASFTVKATGKNCIYQWQYRTSPSDTWKNATSTGAKAPVFKVAATTSRSGYQFRCRVKDDAGNTIYTYIPTLYVLGIKEQPRNVTIDADETALFKVSASGNGRTYQWEYRTSSTGTWKKAAFMGNKTAYLKVTAKPSRSGYQFRCLVKDSAGNKVYTKTVTLKIMMAATKD